MIITSWNIRGLSSRGKQRYLKERLKRDKTIIMIVQETNISIEIMSKGNTRYEIMG